MKSNIIEEFNLPSYVKGKSFAEASKAINNKFKDRVDPQSESTKKVLLERLAAAQEHIKMKEELANAPKTIDQNQLFNGGLAGVQQLAPDAATQLKANATAASTQLENYTPVEVATTSGEGGPGVGAYVGAAGAALDFGNQMFGNTGVDETGLAGRQSKTNAGMGAANGAIKGASAGAAFGPWGAAIGGVVGGAAGLIGGSRANKAIHEGNMNASMIENNKFSNDFSGGGSVIKHDQIDRDLNKLQTVGGDIDASVYGASQLKQGINPSLGSILGKGLSKGAKATGKFLDNNYGEILNAAPIAMNALQLANLEKAAPVTYDRLDARYKPNQIDERALENKVQNEANNTTRALAGATNGSAGALRSNLIGSQLAKTNALSDAYLKATQMNNEDNRFGQQFNAQQDHVNLRTSMLETNERRADEAAYGNNQSMLMGALGENIGDFGKQQIHKKLAIEATDYGWDGQYYVSRDGRRLTPAQYKKIFGIETEDNGKD